MKSKFIYDPTDEGNINAGLLLLATILGLIISLITLRVVWLVVLVILSQYRLVRWLIIKLLYSREVKALNDVMTSARLYDKPDNFTYRRYLKATKFSYLETQSSIEVQVFGNGISNLDRLDALAKNFSDAFNMPCYLIGSNLNSATYRLSKTTKRGKVNENEF